YVDGDSASLGEVCTLISALSRTPLKQCFAITGSINQFGEVQAVGGVNEKIEGFFRLCEARGLTGEQGAIIPQANVTTLMLDERVVQAVRAGQFHIYAVRQADEALSLIKSGSVVVGMLNPFNNELIGKMAARGITAFALEAAPRTSRAQSLDVLSSQANIAGYKAVLLAAHHYPRFMPMLMTAAG
ncbi:ATP-dependent protease, putative, partial [Pseudomonas syringae pv. pisi str. 1704B]